MNQPYRSLAPGVFVSGQVSPDRIAALAELGFALLVNHRPDHESPGQPTSAEIGDAAAAAGLAYAHAPVRGLPDAAAVAATAAALARAGEGRKILMFCRSGMRSTVAWAMVRRGQGSDPEALRAAALEAGYDLSSAPL